MRNFIPFLLLIISSLSAFSQVQLGFPGEDAASVGIYIKNLSTGKVTASNDFKKAVVPASVMKAITAASTLSTLESDFRFDTNVYLTGTVDNGVCTGNLIIESCADPTIDSEFFEDDYSKFASEISNALHREGIDTIRGKIVIHQSLSDAGCVPQWEIDDVAWAYGAGLYGFNFADNAFRIWPLTGKTFPHIPDLNIQVKYAETSDLVRGINSNYLIAYGPRTANNNWMMRSAMQNPAKAYEHLLEKQLASVKIFLENNSVPETGERQLLFTHHSPSLTEILRVMMVESHNLYAEAMLRMLAPGASRKKSIEKELNIWRNRNIAPSYNKILDGSGLARANRIQPAFLGDVLEWMAKSPHCKAYTSLFPKVGEEGTVKGLLAKTPLKGKLVLKSGSMNAVQCYAGYKIDATGNPTHVVVIMVNSFYCDRATLRKSIEKFLVSQF